MPDDQTKAIERLDARMERIETALVSLVRMEERMVTLFKRMDGYDMLQGKMGDRISELERVTHGRGRVFQLIDRGFWIVIAAVLAYGFRLLG